MFSIHSNSSDRQLVFLGLEGDYFTVELRGSSLQATQTVYSYLHGPDLVRLFAHLAQQDRPWTGERVWHSLEHEFSITATCSTLGAVTFAIELRGSAGAEEPWQASATIVTEMGQLPAIAANATRFFCENGP